MTFRTTGLPPPRTLAVLVVCSLIVAGALVNAGHAQPSAYRQKVERSFQAWLANDLWPSANKAGVSPGTFKAAFRGVTLDWDLPELVPPGTKTGPQRVDSQAEFGSPGAYFNQSRLSGQASQGRGHLARWKKTLATIRDRYGVPPGILIAIWARETGFGQASLPHSAIRALATEAFMGRRKDFFRKELIAALRVIEEGHISPKEMRSSWAGALGQPQFLPSYFLDYAVDVDGDGRRDIWESVPDSLGSMANLLRQKGWNPERGWGLEARAPADVSCTLEGPEQGKPMGEWARLGITQVNGEPLPVKGDRLGFLLMPAGRFGPAFIVTENFYVLKEYNYSDLYALYVGHLADRLSGDGAFAAKWGKVGGFTRADVKRMQDALVAEGYDVGNADGLIGFKTRIAVGLWQTRKGLPVTCFPDAKMVRSIH